MRSLSVLALAATLLLATGCGGGAEKPEPKSPSSLTAADLQETYEFWKGQSPQGQLTLSRICKAQAAQAAKTEAESESTSDDPTDGITAGYDAAAAVSALDNTDLVKKIGTSLAASPTRPIGEACDGIITTAVQPTSVELQGVTREGALGPNSYTGKPSESLTVKGTVTPAGDDVKIYVGKRDGDYWDDSLDPVTTDADGNFKVTLKAYRKNSNLYRLKVEGSGAAKPVTVEIYFDRPTGSASAPNSSAPSSSSSSSSALEFSGNGSKRIGTIDVPWAASLKWTNTGGAFGITGGDSEQDIFVSSDAKSGDSAVDAGTYKDVEVSAIGDWTIKIVRR